MGWDNPVASQASSWMKEPSWPAGRVPGEEGAAELRGPGTAVEELKSQQREELNRTQDALRTEQLRETQEVPTNSFKEQSGENGKYAHLRLKQKRKNK